MRTVEFDPGLLCPPPRQWHALGGSVELRLPLRVVLASRAAELHPLLARARRHGWIASIDACAREPGTGLALRIDLDARLRAQAFELRIGEPELLLCAGNLAGARHGIALLNQLFAGLGGALRMPCIQLCDWPDFASRGLMLDISRTRVPSREWLLSLLDTLESLRFNQLQLYTEHTFAYLGHERVWAEASPLTPEDVLELDAAAHERGIELVPNQQCFGHMHRWLIHEPYRALAEVPEGVEHAFSRQREPFALCPTDPGSLRLVANLMDQLLPHFRSREFNVGCDETFDLGLGRSRSACEARGKGRVYLDFLHALQREVQRRDRRMQFWGDIILQHPELIAELPREAIAMEWGYDAEHPFADHLASFAASGLEFRVCPGTSAWQSFGGRTENMLANIASAAREGVAHGASGLLVTDWGDRGHLQPHVVSWPGIVMAAACSWNRASAGAARERLSQWLDRWIFEDARGRLGAGLADLGRVHEWSEAVSTNGKALFFLVAFAELEFPHPRIQSLSTSGLHACLERLTELRVRLESARPRSSQALDGARWVGAMQAFACRLGIARLRAGAGVPLSELPRAQARLLGDELEGLIDEHQRLWALEDRPGGWRESASWLYGPLQALRRSRR